MNFLETDQGLALLENFLKKFEGKASQRVYKSEVKQFFDWHNGGIDELSEDDLHKYRMHLSNGATSGTLKRKFSMLNGFFKFCEMHVKGFMRPAREHGRLASIQVLNYLESESFHKAVVAWKENLVADSTKVIYGNHISLFFKWAMKEPKDLGMDDFTRYRDYLRNDLELKQSTIWTKFIEINRFLKFLAFRNPKFKNPLKFMGLRIVPPKKDKGYYNVLNDQEIKALLDAPDRNTLIGKRDYLIIRLMLGYALRVNEICKLAYQDIERQRVGGKLRIWIRDRKGRIGRRDDTAIILEGKPLEAFDDWFDNCKVKFEPETRVFAPFIYDLRHQDLKIDQRRLKNNKRRDNKTIWNLLVKYLEIAGISRQGRVISPHAMRHTALTVLARNGVNIQDMQKLAAHQDVNTTMIYIHSAQSFDDHIGMKNPINNF